jgi:hypothetical protein
MNDVDVGFCLGACLQGKAYRHSIKEVSPAMMESFFIIFVKKRGDIFLSTTKNYLNLRFISSWNVNDC